MLEIPLPPPQGDTVSAASACPGSMDNAMHAARNSAEIRFFMIAFAPLIRSLTGVFFILSQITPIGKPFPDFLPVACRMSSGEPFSAVPPGGRHVPVPAGV